MEVKRNIIIGKVGGNANENSVNYKVSLPAKMVKDLGVTKEDRSVILTFENNKIIYSSNVTYFNDYIKLFELISTK